MDYSNEKAYLIVINSEGQLNRFNLSEALFDDISIGRKAGNTIRLEENFVSGMHARIIRRAGSFYYTDINNRNGSFVSSFSYSGHLHNDNRLVELGDDAIIRIGDIRNPNRMVIMYFTTMQNGESLDSKRLGQKRISIGRSIENDIVLKHSGVSRNHAYLEKTGSGYDIVDNRSKVGVLVNGKLLDGRRSLHDKDVIQILSYQMIYSNNCIYYKNKLSGINIRVHNVNKYVGKKDNYKQILNNVNLEIKGNEFVAIIGGSGAGKSTVMGVLNGFDNSYEGSVYYNNTSLKENFNSIKDILGYVPQEDIIYENLTLREMLRYTADLRMPADFTQEEIEQRIDEVLATIDLTQHQNTYIRKMSGGQKKRASIAVELLADPKVFFLDEPTSGLDPGTEKNLMIAMKRLSKEQERTIVMVTHTTQSLHLCDKVIFMGKGGKLCFVGGIEEAKAFFETDDLTEIYNLMAADTDRWVRKYNRVSSGSVSSVQKSDIENKSRKNRVSAIDQFIIIAQRYIRLSLNDWRKTMIQIITPIIMGIIVWFIADENFLKTYQGTKSILFTLSCAAIWIGLFAAIQEVCKERSILKREYMANLRLGSYVSAKISVLAVEGVIQAVLLTVVSLGGLSIKYSGDDDIVLTAADTLLGSDKSIFWEVLLTLWLTIFASMALGLLISSFFKNSDKATTTAPFVLIVQLVFSGMLFQLEGAKETVSYATFSRWSVDALGRIANIKTLEEYLEGMDENMFEWSSSGLIQDWMLLFVMGIICLIIATFVLRGLAKDGR